MEYLNLILLVIIGGIIFFRTKVNVTLEELKEYGDINLISNNKPKKEHEFKEGDEFSLLANLKNKRTNDFREIEINVIVINCYHKYSEPYYLLKIKKCEVKEFEVFEFSMREERLKQKTLMLINKKIENNAIAIDLIRVKKQHINLNKDVK